MSNFFIGPQELSKYNIDLFGELPFYFCDLYEPSYVSHGTFPICLCYVSRGTFFSRLSLPCFTWNILLSLIVAMFHVEHGRQRIKKSTGNLACFTWNIFHSGFFLIFPKGLGYFPSVGVSFFTVITVLFSSPSDRYSV